LSAAEFARQQGLSYTTFCGWRARRDKAKALPSFVRVEVASCAAAEGLVMELGSQARIHIHTEKQAALAACLIEQLNKARSC
jgi:hypothetical protein